MNKLEVIEHLNKLGRGEVKATWFTQGICEEVYTCKCFIYIKSYFSTWAKFSGDNSYPIQVSGDAERDYYLKEHKNKWDDNEYGDLRRELCLHIANEMEKELEKNLDKEMELFYTQLNTRKINQHRGITL